MAVCILRQFECFLKPVLDTPLLPRGTRTDGFKKCIENDEGNALTSVLDTIPIAIGITRTDGSDLKL